MTPTVYLVEGADGTGKTTFAEKVGDKVVHNGPPPKHGGEKLFNLYLRQIEEALHDRDVLGLTTVIDRSFLSEAVYGRYRKGGPQISKSQRRWFERYCRRNGIVMIGFVTTQAIRKERIEARGEKWTHIAWLAGIDYAEYFQGAHARRFWITADSSSAHAS